VVRGIDRAFVADRDTQIHTPLAQNGFELLPDPA